jgi:Protein of unknown function (DUF3106)
MRNIFPSRGLALQALLAGLLAGFSGGAYAQQHAAPVVRRPPAMQPANRAGGQRIGGSGEHLPEWMSQHSGLTLQQQEQALGREPGFRELPAQTQQRMLQRLAQLNAMTPQKRQRMLARTEMMERLSPEQRSQVRGAMQQLGSLPPDQRQQVARSFRQLRELPPNQRMAAMYSDRYRWMNDAQRTTLTNLLQVEPMLPPPEPPPL